MPSLLRCWHRWHCHCRPWQLLLALLLVLLLLVLLLLLLHAAIASAEVTAMTAAEIFLIRAFILAGARSTERWTLHT